MMNLERHLSPVLSEIN